VNDLPTYAEHVQYINHLWEATKFWIAITVISIGAILGILSIVLKWTWKNHNDKVSEAYNNSLAALDNDTDQERRLNVIENEIRKMATKEGLDDLKEMLKARTASIMEFIKENTEVARQQFGIVQQAEKELINKYIGRAEKAERRVEHLEKKNTALEKELEKK